MTGEEHYSEDYRISFYEKVHDILELEEAGLYVELCKITDFEQEKKFKELIEKEIKHFEKPETEMNKAMVFYLKDLLTKFGSQFSPKMDNCCEDKCTCMMIEKIKKLEERIKKLEDAE